MKPHQAVRLLLLLLAVGSGGALVLALAAPWLPADLAPPAMGAATTPATDPRGFAELAASACALALVACWAWLALGTVTVAVQALRAPASPSRQALRWVPGLLRVLVPVLLGAVVTAAPSSASTEGGATSASTPIGAAGSTLADLPLPDRLPTPGPDRRTVLVRPGDTLWGIAARLLPASAPPAAVDRGWRRIARANAARLPDPDLIQPGTRLRIPTSTAHPREEAS